MTSPPPNSAGRAMGAPSERLSEYAPQSRGAGVDLRLLTLMSVVLAGLAATLISGQTRHGPGGLALPAGVLCAGLLSGVALDIRRRGLGALLQPEHLVMIALVYFVLLDPLQSLYEVTASDRAVSSTFDAIAVFAAFCAIATMLPIFRSPPRILLRAIQGDLRGRALTIAIVGSFLLGMFNFAYTSGFSLQTMAAGLVAGRWSAPWSRAATGGWNAFGDFTTYFGYVIPILAVMVVREERSLLRRRSILALTLTGVFAMFLAQAGSRRLIGALFLAGVLTWIATGDRRARLRRLAIAAVLSAIMLVALDVMLVKRDAGFTRVDYTGYPTQVRVDDNFLRMAQVFDIIPAEHPHAGTAWLVYTLVRPIPRVFWPGKPVDPGFSLADHLGAPGVSYSTSVVSEWYQAFGWAGIAAGGFIFGVLCRLWSSVIDSRRTRGAIIVYALGALTLVLGVRSMYDVVLMSYPLLCWLIFRRFVTPAGTAVPERNSQ